MTEASEGQHTIPQKPSTSGPGSSRGADVPAPGGTGGSGATTPGASSPKEAAAGSVGPSRALLGPFTLREVVFGGGAVIVFIGTLLPFIDGAVLYTNFWNSFTLFFIGIGILLPVVASALLAGRRMGSSGLRVGSLSVDQFASVAAVLAATFFFLQTVTEFNAGPLVALIGSLGMLAASVAGPFLPGIRNDFTARPEVAAHPAARPITAARPRPPKPAADAKTGPTPTAAPSGQAGPAGVNPAAAAVLQNGAGLYGAGGAGAVGAGPAASGQSGMERGSAGGAASAASSASSSGPRPVHSGSHAGTPAGEDAGRGTRDGELRLSSDGSSVVAPDGSSVVAPDGSSDATPDGPSVVAPDGSSVVAPDGTSDVTPDGTSDATSVQPAVGAVDATRIHDAVRDDAASHAAHASAGEDRRQEPITATRSTDEESVVEAFWFAVGSARPVFDEQTGREVFTLQPGDWEVGIEDRGREFLVQDKRTGAVGILRDLRNIERAPRD